MAKRKKPIDPPESISTGSPVPAGIGQWLGDTPAPEIKEAIEQAAASIWHDPAWSGVELASRDQRPTDAPSERESKDAGVSGTQAQGQTQTNVQTTTETPSPAQTHTSGDTASAAPTPDVINSRVENRMQAKHRWIREGRLEEVERWMQGKRSEYRDTGLARHRANDLAWDAAISHFHPPGQELTQAHNSAPGDTVSAALAGNGNGSPSRVDEQTQVQGMGQIPAEWPTLPDNASLQTELGWVQSQRLRIVEERGNSTVVHLERASSPPPSWSALGWLETSIRSYAKYVDIVAKSLSVVADEQDNVRRERLRLDEIGQLLDEMHRDSEGRR